MELPPFLLDRWIEQKQHPDSRIEFDLASSTGPVWTLRELLALADSGEMDGMLDTRISYTNAKGTAVLRAAIAEISGVDPETVHVVTGASEALLILFFLTAETGANVVLPNPGFPANPPLAESLGIAVRYYTLRAENQFRVDVEEVQRLVDRNTRLVLVNSPHNPTGAVMSKADMQLLHDFCAERSVQFVSDEVYHPIYHGAGGCSAAGLSNATVISDFSKALCLSGLRIGWMIDQDSKRRERYRNARNYFTITANVFGERLAALALRHADRIYGRAREVAQRNLAVLDGVMERHADVLRWFRPQGGMTAFPWLAHGGDTREFCVGLMRRGVLMVPGDCFGQAQHFRLGFAASGETFGKGIERFEEYLGAAVKASHA